MASSAPLKHLEASYDKPCTLASFGFAQPIHIRSPSLSSLCRSVFPCRSCRLCRHCFSKADKASSFINDHTSCYPVLRKYCLTCPCAHYRSVSIASSASATSSAVAYVLRPAASRYKSSNGASPLLCTERTQSVRVSAALRFGSGKRKEETQE